MLAAIGGRFVVLDHVSEVEAFASLHGPLVQGYALDALEAPEATPPSIEDAREFIELLLAAPCTPGRAVGLGEGLRFAFGGLAGTGLICEGELVTLTAFADEPGHDGPAVAGRVRRPSAAVRGDRDWLATRRTLPPTAKAQGSERYPVTLGPARRKAEGRRGRPLSPCTGRTRRVQPSRRRVGAACA